MYIVGYFLQAMAAVIDIALNIALIAIIARAILSWVSPDPYNPIVRIINQVSEPILYPIRKRLPYFSGIDLSPIAALMAIYFLDIFLVQTLSRMGASLL